MNNNIQVRLKLFELIVQIVKVTYNVNVSLKIIYQRR